MTGKVKVGRVLVTLFNFTFLALMITLSIIMHSNYDPGKKVWEPGPLQTAVSYSFPAMFFILFVLLSTTVFILIRKLKD